MYWDDNSVFTFVKRIQSHPCLWNPNDRNKKNRHKVQDAFESIASEMDIEDIDELKKKKENLFQTYRNYRRKVSHSKKSGLDNIYKPTWAPYSLLDGFLHGIYTPKGKIKSEILDNNEEQRNSDEEEADSDNDCSGNEAEKVISNNKPKDKVTRQPIFQRNMKRPRNEHHAEETFQELIPIQNQSQSRGVFRDECAIYTELLAIKLRKLDDRTRELAMHKIDCLVFDMAYNSSSPGSHSVNSYQVQAFLDPVCHEDEVDVNNGEADCNFK